MKHYTLMMIRDPKQSVLRVRIPVFLLLVVPLLFTAACILAYLFYFRSVSYDETNKRLQSTLTGHISDHLIEVSGKDQTIERLQGELLQLSEQAEQLDVRMEELRQLEEEMKRLTGLGQLPVNGKALSAQSPAEAASGIGGRSREVTEADEEQLITDTRAHYETIYSEMETLYGDLSKTKESVLEQLRELEFTPTIWPLDSRTITSPFGMRRDPFSYSMVYHSGLDIGASTGSPVYAAASGKVTFTGSDSQHGNNIIIDHGNGLKTWYMHLSKIETAKGDAVKKGQQIGKVGSTGRSTGPHLHYEVLKNGSSVDPKSYLKSARKEE
jgi:murein DD-endopeptidase MepM/ murein hydrolase activator NlpD